MQAQYRFCLYGQCKLERLNSFAWSHVALSGAQSCFESCRQRKSTRIADSAHIHTYCINCGERVLQGAWSTSLVLENQNSHKSPNMLMSSKRYMKWEWLLSKWHASGGHWGPSFFLTCESTLASRSSQFNSRKPESCMLQTFNKAGPHSLS